MMNSPPKLFLNNKSSALFIKSNEKWKNDENLILSNKCKFDVQYLGTSEISDPGDLATCCAVLKDLIGKKKLIKSVLKITTYSFILFEKSTNEIKVDQTLREIVLCSSHPGIPYTFFYTTRDTVFNVFQLCGFISMKEVNERIVTAMLFALQIYSEHQAESAKCLSNYQKPNLIEHDKSFKQNSLVERYQDPQSSIVISNPRISASKTFTDLKSIPRRRGIDQISNDLFPNLNPSDLFKRSPYNRSELNNSETGYSSHEDLSNVIIPDTDHNKESENDISIGNNIQSTTTLETVSVGYFPTERNKKDQPSKYDVLKNIDKSLVPSGWSEEIAGINKTKSSTNISSSEFDEFISTFLENFNKK